MFTYYSLKKFVPFLKSFMQKKDNKIGNKTAYKEERQIKEKKIEIDLQKNKKNKSKFWLVHMPKKQKKACKEIPVR